uniref:Calpain catalytic domain-containing protein n=1 Tax=Chromera velia CCMP2878 TaxID=1169474 RepID=A0A0G4FYU8_9ALVE|eukprot:Cvel_19443.t1-p1 / transcript=Cvel_19443.t1 / gene=Cvel_19443 / organism=Chromera_velia_CCMP2878 / gene_product=Calpain-15, putative / transcript_product=Calpain-15, putative / location=Cvel_scaffold1676:31893-39385(+) / protein_length=1000 / sequence_SO=supercontig / SO=protein_coding / is_pseudo=false
MGCAASVDSAGRVVEEVGVHQKGGQGGGGAGSKDHLDPSFFLDPSDVADTGREMRGEDGKWLGKRKKAYLSSAKNVDAKALMDARTEDFSYRVCLGDGAAKELIDSIIRHCETQGGKFWDWQFPPTDLSLAREPNNDTRGPEGMVWCRATEIWEEGKADVVKKGVTPDDVCQGGLGNCYMIAGIAAMAQFPDVVTAHVYPDKVNKAGIYGVRLWRRDRWVWILLDDFLPCQVFDGQKFTGLVSSKNEGEFWPCLVEKAFAKVASSYQAISAGQGLSFHPSNSCLGGLLYLLCASAECESNIDKRKKFADKVWAVIEAGKGLWGLDGGTENVNGQENELGLVQGHAYTVLGGMKVGDTRLVRMRNTWGSFEWKGAWGDSSPLWDDWPEEKEKVKKDLGDNQGIFWIPLFSQDRQDFIQYFGGLWFNLPQPCVENGQTIHNSLPESLHDLTPMEPSFSWSDCPFDFDKIPYKDWRPETRLIGCDPNAPVNKIEETLPASEAAQCLSRSADPGKTRQYAITLERPGSLWIRFVPPHYDSQQGYPILFLVETPLTPKGQPCRWPDSYDLPSPWEDFKAEAERRGLWGDCQFAFCSSDNVGNIKTCSWAQFKPLPRLVGKPLSLFAGSNVKPQWVEENLGGQYKFSVEVKPMNPQPLSVIPQDALPPGRAAEKKVLLEMDISSEEAAGALNRKARGDKKVQWELQIGKGGPRKVSVKVLTPHYDALQGYPQVHLLEAPKDSSGRVVRWGDGWEELETAAGAAGLWGATAFSFYGSDSQGEIVSVDWGDIEVPEGIEGPFVLSVSMNPVKAWCDGSNGGVFPLRVEVKAPLKSGPDFIELDRQPPPSSVFLRASVSADNLQDAFGWEGDDSKNIQWAFKLPNPSEPLHLKARLLPPAADALQGYPIVVVAEVGPDKGRFEGTPNHAFEEHHPSGLFIKYAFSFYEQDFSGGIENVEWGEIEVPPSSNWFVLFSAANGQLGWVQEKGGGSFPLEVEVKPPDVSFEKV